MAENRTESKYARNRALRFSRGGRVFKSLGEGAIQTRGAEAINPMPRPFDPEYFPVHTISYLPLPGNEPMAHEDIKMLSRFRNKDHKYPEPKYKQIPKNIKYDHYNMNYTGWNR